MEVQPADPVPDNDIDDRKMGGGQPVYRSGAHRCGYNDASFSVIANTTVGTQSPPGATRVRVMPGTGTGRDSIPAAFGRGRRYTGGAGYDSSRSNVVLATSVQAGGGGQTERCPLASEQGQQRAVMATGAEVLSGERGYYKQITAPWDSRGRLEPEESYRHWVTAESRPCT